MKRFGAHAALLLAFAAVACTPKVSDTGYVGTWAKSDGGEYSRSTIAIARRGDAYLFRWKVDSQDGKWKVRCDWDGTCEEQVDGEKVATHRFVTRMDPATGHLLVECTGTVVKPKHLDLHYVDELVLEPGGLALWSITRERAGQTFEGEARPRRKFDKVANEVGGGAP